MKILAGVDEVGRGSLIGPVYAAAVILNNSIDKKLLKDSKTLTKDKREELEKYIKKNSIWAIGQASTKEIEKINILHASLLAMKRAILKLKTKPSLVLIDGNKLPDLKNYKLEYIIKGDQKFRVFLLHQLLQKSVEINLLQNFQKNLMIMGGIQTLVMEPKNI